MIVNNQNICYACGDVNDENNCIECEKIDLALGLLKISRNKTFLQRHTRKIKADIVTYEREFENWMFLIKLFSIFLVLVFNKTHLLFESLSAENTINSFYTFLQLQFLTNWV